MNSVLDDLTSQQVKILEELSRYGQTNKQIADNIGCSEGNIKTHLTNAMEKIGAINRTHAVIVYLQLKAERLWSEDHGPDELYRKFQVWSINHKQWLPDNEFFFVLRPETDKHAFAVMQFYAHRSYLDYPERARQIKEKLEEIEARNGA